LETAYIDEIDYDLTYDFKKFDDELLEESTPEIDEDLKGRALSILSTIDELVYLRECASGDERKLLQKKIDKQRELYKICVKKVQRLVRLNA